MESVSASSMHTHSCLRLRQAAAALMRLVNKIYDFHSMRLHDELRVWRASPTQLAGQPLHETRGKSFSIAHYSELNDNCVRTGRILTYLSGAQLGIKCVQL